MRTRITTRQCDVPDALREHTREVLGRLAKFGHRVQYGGAVFRSEGTEHVVELTVHAVRNQTYHATGSGRDFRTALDRARAKIRRQFDGRAPNLRTRD